MKEKMKKYSEETYQNLLKLVENNESFYFKDFTLKDSIYRIFSYRLASWSSFMEPSALNCRGIMFDVTDKENVYLVSLPPEKFFNYEEGSVNHSVGNFGDKMHKMDGSLISTYINEGDLYLKSKASLFSEQAMAAMKYLSLPENSNFKEELKLLDESGYTINMEYTSPTNRIVVPYNIDSLTVLSIRSRETGENYFASKLENFLKTTGTSNEIINRLVKYENISKFNFNHEEFVTQVRNEKEGEGYVVEVVINEIESYLVKIKNLNYMALHHTKDSVNSPRRLFEVVINEASDDLRLLFEGDEYILNEITKMENHVQPIYNHIVKTVEDFYNDNKLLERKEYAIKAKTEQPNFLGLIMNLYIAGSVKDADKKKDKNGNYIEFKGNNYKEFAIKHRKDLFAISDEELELDENGNVVRKIVTSPTSKI
jgi:RNA ligase